MFNRQLYDEIDPHDYWRKREWETREAFVVFEKKVYKSEITWSISYLVDDSV